MVLFLRQWICFVARGEASFPEFNNFIKLLCFMAEENVHSKQSVLVNVPCVCVCSVLCLTFMIPRL